jgi:hypothetical protein
MDREVQNLVENTDFVGYVTVDWNGVFNKTNCPNTAVSMALERHRAGGETRSDSVKVYSIGTMGKYHHTPGERRVEEFNWRRALRELMG